MSPHENTHICPKCGSKDIFVIDGHADAYDAGNNIPYDPTIFIYIPADRYICGACGCSEEWLRQEDLEKAAIPSTRTNKIFFTFLTFPSEHLPTIKKCPSHNGMSSAAYGVGTFCFVILSERGISIVRA